MDNRQQRILLSAIYDLVSRMEYNLESINECLWCIKQKSYLKPEYWYEAQYIANYANDIKSKYELQEWYKATLWYLLKAIFTENEAIVLLDWHFAYREDSLKAIIKTINDEFRKIEN